MKNSTSTADSVSAPTEIELKLALAPAQLNTLLCHAALWSGWRARGPARRCPGPHQFSADEAVHAGRGRVLLRGLGPGDDIGAEIDARSLHVTCVEFHHSVGVDDLGFDLESVVIGAQGLHGRSRGEARVLGRNEHSRATSPASRGRTSCQIPVSRVRVDSSSPSSLSSHACAVYCRNGVPGWAVNSTRCPNCFSGVSA